MTVAVADTTVIIHLYRRHSSALKWYKSLPQPLGITSITWLEVMYGAGSKAKQIACKRILDEFNLLYLSILDQSWAMEQMERLRFSHGVSINDCLIASVAYRLNIPLYTHNLKDMASLVGELAIKPYA